MIDLIASTAKLGSLSFMGTTHLLFFIWGEIKVGFLVLGFCFFTTLWFFPFVNLETLCMGMYGLWVILVCDRSKFFVVVVFGLGFLILIWVLDCVYLAVEFCNLD